MSENRARRTNQIRIANHPRWTCQRCFATAGRVVLLSLITCSLSCFGGGEGGDGDDRDDGPTGPGGGTTNFTEDTSVQGVVTLAELTVAAGVTITATDNLVCDIQGDVVINGDLVGDCVEITVFGQGSLTINGTVRNECSVTPAAGQAPPLVIVGQGEMSLTGATIRSSGQIEIRNSSLAAPQFEGAPVDVQPPLGEPPAVMTIVNSTIEVGPGNALDGPAGQFGGTGETGEGVLIVVHGDIVFEGTTLIKGQDGGSGGDALHEGGPARAEGGPGGFGGVVELLASGEIDFGTGGVTIESGRGGDGGGATAIGLPGAGGSAPGAEAEGGRGEAGGELRILGLAGVRGGTDAHLRVGDSGTGGWAEATGADGDPEQCRDGQAQWGGDATAGGGEGSSSWYTQILFGAPIVFDEDPIEGGKGGVLAAFQYCTHVAIENCTLGALT